MLRDVPLDCPYCGERISLLVDDSAGGQRYIEDCAVCCQPMELVLQVNEDGDFVDLIASRGDE